MKKTIEILAGILALSFLLAIASCSDNPITPPTNPTDPIVPDPVAVTGVSITTDPEDAKVAQKGTLTLTASVIPPNATNKGLAWTIDKEKIATVNVSTGVVTGVKKGTAVVTVTTLDGGKTDKITISVEETIDVTGVMISAADKELVKTIRISEQRQIYATVSPDGVDKTVRWDSSAPNVASVSPTGLITGVSRGQATITATSVADETKKDQATVNVPDATPVTAILLRHPDHPDEPQSPDFRETPLYMFSGETKTLEYLIVPTGALENVEVTSSNTAVASVYKESGSNNRIKIGAGNTQGDSIIYLKSVSYPSIVAYLTVHVTKDVTITRNNDVNSAIIIGGSFDNSVTPSTGKTPTRQMMTKTDYSTLEINLENAWTTVPALETDPSQKLQILWTSSDPTESTVGIEVDPKNPMKATLVAKKGTKQGVALTSSDTAEKNNVKITVYPFLNQLQSWIFDVNVREILENDSVTLEGTGVSPKNGTPNTYELSLKKGNRVEITAKTGNGEPTITSIEWYGFEDKKVTYVGNDPVTGKKKIEIIAVDDSSTVDISVVLKTYSSATVNTEHEITKVLKVTTSNK
jgi:hypothetical protein